MLEYLLRRGANSQTCRRLETLRRWIVYCRDGEFSYPLHIAASLGNTTAIELLLQHGASVNHPFEKSINQRYLYITPLKAAIVNEQTAAAKLLLSRGADLNGDHFLLSYAVQYSTPDTLRMLITFGAGKHDIYEALGHAARTCNYDMLAILLNSGVDADGRSSQPLTLSRDQKQRNGEESCGFKEEIQTYGDEPCGIPLIMVVASSRYSESNQVKLCAALLINSGANVNRIGARSYMYGDDWILSTENSPLIFLFSGEKTTALHTAAYFGNQDMVRFLVQKGANVNSVLGDHYTALTSALHSEVYARSDEFLAYTSQSDTTKVDQPRTASLRVRATLRLLVDLGADSDLCAPDDNARIHLLLNMSPEECETLRSLQLIVAETQVWTTPHEKTYAERRDELKSLLQKGADPSLCCKKEQERIEEYLTWTEKDITELDLGRECQISEEMMNHRRRGLAYGWPSSPKASESE